MPIYEYQCDKCGERFEVFVRSSKDQNKVVCSACKSTKVHKALSLFGLGGGSAGKSSAASCGPGPV